ncbi:long-chain-fatty-acid--CoA ligase [Nocardia sp. GCM10030253]|uniref:long-chain-fatty-acid--CoA ligase n=1 Tax=Nocardia sp. GCM10030253 TaxID=3273404 RepID=UPI003629E690
MIMQSTTETSPGTIGLPTVIGEHAAHRPDAVALVCGDRVTSYATLHRISRQVANALLAEKLRPGDRIGYLGRDSELFYALLIAAAGTGIVLVPINWRLTAAELTHILGDSGARLLFVDAGSAADADGALARLPGEITVLGMDRDGVAGAGFAEWHAGQPDSAPEFEASRLNPLLQMYTSGTTGKSKGVVVSQQSLFAVRDVRHGSEMAWLEVPEDDVALVIIPGFHIAGLAWVVQGLIDGIVNVILPEYTPGLALRAIRNRGVTALYGVPIMLALILIEPGVRDEDFADLRLVAYGGSPIPEDMLAQCMERFGCEFLQFYGMTETATPIAFLPPQDHWLGNPRLRSAGFPYRGAQIAVLDKAGNRLPPGEVGEVVVHGPAPMVEYWNRPEATAATLIDGWIHTGDAGYLDADGYLFISDRIKDMIIVAGENVYPAEVENVIVSHPAVREAAVVGAPDARWGETIHAFVALTPGQSVTPRELALFLRDKLASFKHPQHFAIVDALPRNASGKILRRELREQFWQGRERAVN